MKHSWNIILVCLILQACTAELIGPQPTDPTVPSDVKGRKVYLVNEGNFGRGGASISAYVPKTKTHYPSLFSGANNGQQIGDVAQDLERHGDRYYAVLNASGYIGVLDTTDLKLLDSISGSFNAPRYFTNFEETGFVTDLFANKLWVIDLAANELTGSIPLPSSGSHLIAWNNYIAVCISDQLALVDPLSLQLDTLINLNSQLDRLRISAEGSLLVLTKGKGNLSAQLSSIDEQLQPEWTYSITNGSPRYLSLNAQSDYPHVVLGDGVYQLKHHNGQNFNLHRIIELTDENVYAFDIDPFTGDMYLANALDFDQASDLYRFDSTGVLMDQFKAGIITTDFHFTPAP